MLVVFSLVALFIAWIWVDYFRLIDIYNRDSLLNFIAAFVIGCLAVPLTFGIGILTDHIGFKLGGGMTHDFVYCVLLIGLPEELAKLASFGLFYLIFRKKIKEPIDLLAYIATCALGFSAVENVLYFQDYGPDIIFSRGILCSVGHMFDTAIMGYGLILYKFKKPQPNVATLPLFILLAALTHGFYDFWLIHEGLGMGGYLVTVLFFLICVSVFAVILNNAINQSSFFTYKLSIDTDKLFTRMLVYYSIVLGVQMILIGFSKDILAALIGSTLSLFTTGFIVMITLLRLTRFTLIKGHWHPLRVEFPFTIASSANADSTGAMGLRIKGSASNEMLMGQFYQCESLIAPLSPRKSALKQAHRMFIEEKYFLDNNQSFYLTRLYFNNERDQWMYVMLKPKMNGTVKTKSGHPIVAVLRLEHLIDFKDPSLKTSDFKFQEWAVLRKVD